MTGIPERNTQFAKWRDPDAWMERMKGPQWKQTLREEKSLVDGFLNTPGVQRRIGPFRAEYDMAYRRTQNLRFPAGPIEVQWNSEFNKTWNWIGSPQERDARDLDATKEGVWVIEDVGKGAELFELQYWPTMSAKKPLWTKKPVGPNVAVMGDTVFYLGVENKLIYHQMFSCDARTGANQTLLYQETNPEVNLSLEKQGDGRLVLVKDNSQDTECFLLPYLTRTQLHPVPRSWILPLHGAYGIAFVWASKGFLITKQHGKQSLWKCSYNRSPKKLLELPAGQILLNPYSVWNDELPCVVRITEPAHYTQWATLTSTEIVRHGPTIPTGLREERIQAISVDGTVVHGICISSRTWPPTCLLAVGYGAYGLPTATPPVVQRWAPLIRRGWCILYTFPRGGGDHTEAWAKAGRRECRQRTLDDFEALIRKAQKLYHISQKHTAIYGRSAGGLLMGGTLSRFPSGSLMSAVYTEVPYVDELRTTTNPDLPLTTLEYNEFGNPLHRLEDFISVGTLSPANSATVTPSPDVFVLTRTAANDSQVFAYESVKWIRRLRSSGGPDAKAPKLCVVEEDQGHFTPPDATSAQWATDAAFLDAWMDGAL
jgi:protease II